MTLQAMLRYADNDFAFAATGESNSNRISAQALYGLLLCTDLGKQMAKHCKNVTSSTRAAVSSCIATALHVWCLLDLSFQSARLLSTSTLAMKTIEGILTTISAASEFEVRQVSLQLFLMKRNRLISSDECIHRVLKSGWAKSEC